MNLPSPILVTGATGKIGAALSRALALQGASLVLVARDGERLQTLQASLVPKHASQTFRAAPCDLLAPGAATQLVRTWEGEAQRPGGLVHCARSLDHLKADPDGRVPRAQWTDAFLLDVVAGYELTLALAAQERAALASVVMVSSMYGVTPPTPTLYEQPAHIPPIHYGVCKAAQIQLARELAIRLAPQKIRVNAVSYGGVRGRANPAFEQRYAAHCPSGRMLEEAELAGPVLYLLSAESAATTGHNLLAEGGWTVW